MRFDLKSITLKKNNKTVRKSRCVTDHLYCFPFFCNREIMAAIPVTRLTITTLFSAVKTGQTNVIENSLRLYGLPRSGTKTTDYLILQTALQKNFTQIAKLLINAGCRVKPMPNDTGYTPLAYAFILENEEIALMIMKKGTTISVTSSSRTSVLHLAAERKSLKMLKFIFICNIDVNLLDDNGRTALQILLGYANSPEASNRVERTNLIEMIRFLLSKGASVDFKTRDGKTTLHHVVSLKQEDIIKFVLQKCGDVNVQDNQGKTALHVFLNSNFESEDRAFEIVKLFIDKGARVNILDSQSVTVCHLAAEKKYFKILTKLMQCQCNISLQDYHGYTILHRLLENSAHWRDQETITYFVDAILSAASLENIKNSFGKTPVHLAAENHHYKILEKMLPKFQNINAVDNSGETLLHILLKSLSDANHKIVERLINNGADVDLKNRDGVTPVDLAFKSGNRNLLHLMISHSKNLNQHDFQHSKTILHYLSDIQVESQSEELEYIKIAEKCLNKGANVDAVDNLSRTPLLAAVMNQRKSMVEVLLKHGANPNFNSSHSTVVEYLILKSTLSNLDLEIADMLVSKGAGSNITFNGLLFLLKHLDSQEESSLLKKLLNNCKNINVVDPFGNTALHAVLKANVNIKDVSEEKLLKTVKLLVAKGILVNSRNLEGVTALHLAAKNKYSRVAEYLLENGTNIDLLDNAGNSVLHYVGMLNVEIDFNVEKNLIELFLAKGCNLNARNILGMTPLLTAGQSGCTNVTKTLISHGASFTSTSGENSSSPLHIAAEQGYHHNCIKFMLKYGANVYSRTKDGKTALHVAALHGRHEIAKELISTKMDPDVRDYQGKTALHWACWHGNHDIVKLLLAMGADVNALDKNKVTPLMLSQNSNNEIWATLQMHVKRLEVAGVNIPMQSIVCINNYKKRVDTKDLVNAAKLEVSKLHQKFINKNITVADVLKMKLDKLAILQNNDDFKNLLTSADFSREFPNYYYIVMACLARGTVRDNLLKKGQNALNCLVGLPLPDICAEEILKYVDNDALINLTQAADLLKEELQETIRSEMGGGTSSKRVRRAVNE